MELKPYKEILAMTKEAVDKALAPIRAKKIKSKAALESSKIEEEIATLETEIQELCADKDLNFEKLLDKLDKVALLERRQKQYEKVVKQLFPD